MKRILSALIVLALAVSMAGCSVQDYQTAGTLYKEGKYAQALEIYEALGDYADSAKMAEICRQKANYEKVLKEIQQRDFQDTHREVAPLKMCRDSIKLDTSDMNLEEAVAAMKEIIEKKVGQ